MMISNLGGPDQTIKLMLSSNRKPCCCCPNDPLKFYNRVRGALFQFLVLRPIVMILAAFAAYNDMKPLTLIFTGVGLAMLAYGFLSLVLFCMTILSYLFSHSYFPFYLFHHPHPVLLLRSFLLFFCR